MASLICTNPGRSHDRRATAHPKSALTLGKANKAKLERADATPFSQALQPRGIERKGYNHEERDMWIVLFSLTLGAAACFGVTALVLARSKYLARLSG